jgi:hypothetical protein
MHWLSCLLTLPHMSAGPTMMHWSVSQGRQGLVALCKRVRMVACWMYKQACRQHPWANRGMNSPGRTLKLCHAQQSAAMHSCHAWVVQRI